MSESKVDDRLARLFPDREPSVDRAAGGRVSPPATAEPPAPRRSSLAPPAARTGEPLIYADVADSPPT